MAACGCGGGPSTITLLQSTPLYAYLDDAELEVLAHAFVRRSVKAGRPVPDSPFYIVLSGGVDVKQGGVVLCHKRTGTFFSRKAGQVDAVSQQQDGDSQSRAQSEATVRFPPNGGGQNARRLSSIALGKRLSIMMNRDKARHTPFEEDDDDNATTEVLATVSSQLLVILPAKLLELKESNAEIYTVIQTMSHANVERYLAKVPFIRRAALTPEQLRTLGELGTYLARDANTCLFRQGEKADAFYVLLHGSVEAWVSKAPSRMSLAVGEELPDSTAHADWRETEPSPAPAHATGGGGGAPAGAPGPAGAPIEERVAVFGAGNHIGESALVVEGDRSADIRVVEKSIFFKLEKANFAQFLSVAPALERGILQHTKERLLQVYRQARTPFFAELTDAKLRSSASHALLRHYEDGEVICTKGGEGTEFYVVVGGRVCVDPAGGGGAGRTLQPGGYFGEISMLLHDQPIIATCTAETRTTLLVLPHDGFLSMFTDEPELRAYMRIKILRRHCTLQDLLDHSRAKDLFRNFLKSEYADESLLFWEGVAAYKALDAADARRPAAKALVDEFLPDGAARQINVPSACQKATIAAAAAEGALSADIFDAARKEVYTLMARDSVPRFFKTAEFELLLEHFGSYDLEESIGMSTSAIELTMLETHDLTA